MTHGMHVSEGPPTTMARASVALAAGGVVLVAAGAGLFGIAYAVGGVEATEDNWVGMVTALALYAALLATFAGFAVAAAARARHHRWSHQWLPLAVFPALVGLLLLGEWLWWE